MCELGNKKGSRGPLGGTDPDRNDHSAVQGRQGFPLPLWGIHCFCGNCLIAKTISGKMCTLRRQSESVIHPSISHPYIHPSPPTLVHRAPAVLSQSTHQAILLFS